MSSSGRRSTAVYGGSRTIEAPCILSFKVANMSLIPLEYATRTARKIGDEPRDPAFGDYVRWEYPPAERPYVILGARGGAVMYLARTHPKQAVPRRTGRLARWLRAVRKSAPAPTRTVDEAATE